MRNVKIDIHAYMSIHQDYGVEMALASPFGKSLILWHREQANHNLEVRLDLLVDQFDKLIRQGKLNQAAKIEAWIDQVQETFVLEFYKQSA